jgi:predicted kinase
MEIAEVTIPSKRRLWMTVGLPRIGKTTWALTQDFPIVSPDAIRIALTGRAFVPQAEKFVWATAHAMVEALFYAGHESVLFDATSVSEKRRSEWRDPRWRRVFVVFQPNVQLAKERARDSNFPEEVIDRMADNFTFPDTPEYGEWEDPSDVISMPGERPLSHWEES